MDFIDSEYRVVTVVYKTPSKGLDFGLDENFRLVLMEPTALLGHLFVQNDQILFVNGVTPGTPGEAMTLMERKDSENVTSVLRSEYIEPIARERARTVELQRRRGYCYFTAKLKLTETNKKQKMFSIRQVNRNVYVAEVPIHGIAHGILFPGDFILDVDGVKSKTLTGPAVKRLIAQKLSTVGEISMIIERAENYEIRVMTLNALKLKPMPRKIDPDMPCDAAAIGSRQAEYHFRNNRTAPLLPKSVLKVTATVQPPPVKTRSPKIKKTRTTTGGTTTGITVTGDEEGATTTKTKEIPDGVTMPGDINAIEEDMEDAPRRVSFTSSHPEVLDIATDHDGTKQLQKVPNRQKLATNPSLLASILLGVPTLSSPSKPPASKILSVQQTRSQIGSAKKSTRKKASK